MPCRPNPHPSYLCLKQLTLPVAAGIPTSFHGADKDRAYNQSEIERFALYQMITLEKWSDPLPCVVCSSPPPLLHLPALTSPQLCYGVSA